MYETLYTVFKVLRKLSYEGVSRCCTVPFSSNQLKLASLSTALDKVIVGQLVKKLSTFYGGSLSCSQKRIAGPDTDPDKLSPPNPTISI